MVGHIPYNGHAGHEAQGNGEFGSGGATGPTHPASPRVQPTAHRGMEAGGGPHRLTSMPPPLPDPRTILADISTWHMWLPKQYAVPLVGPTGEADAILYGRTGYADETLFLYGYTVGEHEHCFLYDTPWDETHRAYGNGPSEWYDGLEMPRPFRVRYSVSEPERHEIVDPLLKEMMKRPLHRIGTRPAVAHPLTARADEVLLHIDRWDERLPYLRPGSYLEPANGPRAAGWTPVTARFGGIVGRGDAVYAHYRFPVDGTEYVFAVKLERSEMTPSDYAPQSSRKERRAHLKSERRQDQAIRSLESGQELRVRFSPNDPKQHTLELPPLRDGEPPPVLGGSTTAYQLEPLVPLSVE